MCFLKHRSFDQVLCRVLWLLAAIFVVIAALGSITCANGLHAEGIADTIRHSTGTLSNPDSTKWATFRDSVRGFEFRYPKSLLTLIESVTDVKLEHSVLFEHSNPCNEGDSARLPLSYVRDFSVSMRVTAENLASVIANNTYLTAELPGIIKPGYLAGIKIGELLGFQVIHGIEGCGWSAYYFALNRDSTLIVIRSYATELNPIINDFQMYLQLPGISSPEEEERLFYELLSTFKWLH